MRISRALAFLVAGAAVVGTTACDDELTTPEFTQVSLVMTDAPGTIENLWVDFSRVFLVNGEGEEVELVGAPTGAIEVTALAEEGPATLAVNLSVPSGQYVDLRFDVAGAAIETEDGDVFAYGDIALPGGRTSDGALPCAECDEGPVSAVIPEVQGEARRISLLGGGVVFVVDFDVPLSVEPPPPGGGQWSLDPVLHTSETSTLLHVGGDVVLAQGVTVPECPAGTPRDVGSFIPLARAETFRDGTGARLLRSGETDAATSTYALDFLQSDNYDLEHVEEVVVGDDWMLVFEATPLPTRAEPATTAVTQLEAQYTIESVTCEPR